MSAISEKMKTRLKESQGISSEDVEALVKEQDAEEKASAAASAPADAMDSASSVKPEKPESHDAVLGASVAELDSKNFFLGLLGAATAQDNIQITPDDKFRFVDAVLSGGRMKTSFSFFNGKLSFTIKNRTYAEARAAMTMASREGNFSETNTLFAMRLRVMLMCMQVDEFNGTSFPDADTLGPLMPVYENGQTVQPKWMDRISFFGNLPEAVFESIWQCIYEFEQKYWTLVRHSRDQDFWRPE